MPSRPKKPAHEMTTEEAVEHLFGKRAVSHVRKHVASDEKPQVRKGKRPIKKQSK